mmetsp:Transcript_40240/g.81080  ORF Transcript_40240/g.81080 Transcript_40240/m.81080 type:complete len:324 (-) Transcript_40240:33-1004(-)
MMITREAKCRTRATLCTEKYCAALIGEKCEGTSQLLHVVERKPAHSPVDFTLPPPAVVLSYHFDDVVLLHVKLCVRCRLVRKHRLDSLLPPCRPCWCLGSWRLGRVVSGRKGILKVVARRCTRRRAAVGTNSVRGEVRHGACGNARRDFVVCGVVCLGQITSLLHHFLLYLVISRRSVDLVDLLPPLVEERVLHLDDGEERLVEHLPFPLVGDPQPRRQPLVHREVLVASFLQLPLCLPQLGSNLVLFWVVLQRLFLVAVVVVVVQVALSPLLVLFDALESLHHLMHRGLNVDAPRIVQWWPDLIRKVVADMVEHHNQVLYLS